MQIQISIQRPLLVALLVSGVAVASVWVSSPHPSAGAEGGQLPAATIAQASQDIDRERTRQAVLDHQEEILRYELSALETQALTLHSPDAIQRLGEQRAVLLALIRERARSEELLKQSLQQLWDAQGTAFDRNPESARPILQWPIAPLLGISAHFEDPAYEQLFHVAHHAIDIPTEQGTPVTAPLDGMVVAAKDNGIGYSYVILQHEGGLETTYGHVSGILVEEGEHLKAGQVIALTGGQPGSRGAGLLTTGPHLHFAVRDHGRLVDPIKYLVKYALE